MRGMVRATQRDVRLDTSLESLLERAAAHDEPRVLATLVATAGSTYRKPGARMLILADGSYHGLLSGGCLEADLGLHAQQVLTTGVARAVEYDMRGPDDVLFGIGAGCEGAMRVLLEPAGPGTLAHAALIAAAGTTRQGGATSLVAVHEAANLPLGTYGAGAALPAELRTAAARSQDEARSQQVAFETGGGPGRAFVQYLAPPPHLLVCGAGPDAQPVVGAALALGWRVSVVDHRPAYAVAQRFVGAAVHRLAAHELCRVVDVGGCHAAVVMSHHLPSDVTYLQVLADAGEPDFVGLLGPRARRTRIAEELGDAAAKLQSRIRGPVGIDIGAVTPEGIALSIVAQIHAWLAGRTVAATPAAQTLLVRNRRHF
jgi:xanthine dehydrogenase accessory factor